MSITIRNLDPAGADTVSTLLPLLRAATATDLPRHPEPTASYLRRLMMPRANWDTTCLVAYDGDRAAGYGCLAHDVEINPDLVYGDLRIAAQDRAEVTGPLIEASKEYARSRGAVRLVLDSSEFSGYEPLHSAAGGRVLAADCRRQVDLTAIDRAQYAAWAAPSEKNAHYRFEIWTIPTPEDLLPALIEAYEAMRDAPHGDLEFKHAPPDVDRRRRTEAAILASGPQMYIAAALTQDGEIGGFHEVLVLPDFRMADVGNTGVPAKFRGHGLGLRLKTALALHLLTHEPHLTTISTWNDAQNAPMVRVNEAMGYEMAENWSSWQFDL